MFVCNFCAMELSILRLLAIAQFGPMTVVKKGYAYLGYAAFITLFVPFVVHAVATKGKEI